MTTNVEEFLIEFGFKDKEVVQGIKKLLKTLDKVGDAQKQNSSQAQRGIKKENDLLATQNSIRAKQRREINFQESRNMRFLRGRNSGRAQELTGLFSAAVAADDLRMMKRLNVQVAELASQYRKADRAAVGLSTAQRGLKDSTRNLIRSFASMYAILEGGRAINRVGQDFQTMRAGMLAASGSAQQAGKDLAFVDEQAERLGLNLKQTSKDFVKLRAVNKDFSDDQLKEVFLGVAEAGTVLGLSADDTTGALRA